MYSFSLCPPISPLPSPLFHIFSFHCIHRIVGIRCTEPSLRSVTTAATVGTTSSAKAPLLSFVMLCMKILATSLKRGTMSRQSVRHAPLKSFSSTLTAQIRTIRGNWLLGTIMFTSGMLLMCSVAIPSDYCFYSRRVFAKTRLALSVTLKSGWVYLIQYQSSPLQTPHFSQRCAKRKIEWCTWVWV